jgi:glycosyltransferase involved in cell wall biosynthesis
MVYGVILPHTLLFGGVKHFLELGNILVRRGNEFIVFTPEGHPADWFPYIGKTERLSELSNFKLDLLFISETDYLKDLLASNATLKVFYHISQKSLKEVLKHPEVHIFANSSTVHNLIRRKYGVDAVKVFGGIDTKVFYPKNETRNEGEPFTVLAFGRLSRKKKGIPIIVRACERLHRSGYNIKLLFFDTPIDQRSKELYEKFKCKVPFEFVLNHPVMENVKLFHRADVYLCAEARTGWSNPSIEAMASGVPVIGTTSGTTDFLIDNETGLVVWRNSWSFGWALKKLIKKPELGRRFVKNALVKIEEFTWEKMADHIEEFVNKQQYGKSHR